MPEGKPETREISIVAVPEHVFRQVVDRLATQPYKDVASLLAVLLTYQVQTVQVVK